MFQPMKNFDYIYIIQLKIITQQIKRTIMKVIAIKSTNSMEELFLSRICNTCLKLVPINSTGKLVYHNDDEAVKQAAIFATLPNTEYAKAVEYSDIALNQQYFRPVCKIDTNCEFAKQHGIQDWHHILFLGDLLVTVLWDKRCVVNVLLLNKLEDIDHTLLPYLHFIWDDKGNLNQERTSPTRAAVHLNYNKHTVLTNEQIDAIKANSCDIYGNKF
jgi:hypothetical protein